MRPTPILGASQNWRAAGDEPCEFTSRGEGGRVPPLLKRDKPTFVQKIVKREERKHRTFHKQPVSLWLGLAIMGKVGWTVVVPGLIGTALGAWIDSRAPGSYSWALVLFGAGTGFGCMNALRWLGVEHERIKNHERMKKQEGSHLHD